MPRGLQAVAVRPPSRAASDTQPAVCRLHLDLSRQSTARHRDRRPTHRVNVAVDGVAAWNSGSVSSGTQVADESSATSTTITTAATRRTAKGGRCVAKVAMSAVFRQRGERRRVREPTGEAGEAKGASNKCAAHDNM